jgi:predicted N-acetyltransferase YhbS
MIQISPLDPLDYSTCLDMVVQSFVSRNAAIQHLQVPANELRQVFQQDTQDFIALSLVAKTVQGEVVGSLLVNQCDFMKDEMKPLHSNLRHFYDVGEALYHQAAWSTQIGLASIARGETMHVICGGTKEGYEGQGVGTQLRRQLKEHARHHGFQRILVEAISPATIHIWTKLGYHVRAKTRLRDFRGQGGVRHFANIQPPDAEYVIFEGLVDDTANKNSVWDRLCCAFWLAVILCKNRRWFKSYTPSST